MAGGGARGLDQLFDRTGAHLDFEVVDGGAGNGHHHRRGVAEIALKLHRRGSGGKAAIEGLQFEIDIAELRAAVLGFLRQLDVDERSSGQRDGADAVIGGAGWMDGFILRDGLFDWSSDELLDFLRRSSGPLASGDGDAHRNFGVLALGHREISVDSPDDDAE